MGVVVKLRGFVVCEMHERMVYVCVCIMYVWVYVYVYVCVYECVCGSGGVCVLCPRKS